ncbi:MAG TPA: glycosyltransferase [Bryobacteraceae bacterium]|jgi:glycosyltransferase involved in cell wall biosynthesis|nr:glycosyltransferase [Bryobacteraceae bacterium]
MRILELTEAAAGGVGRHVIDLSEGLLARGHEVHLAYSTFRSDDVFAEDLRRLKRMSGLETCRIQMRHMPSLTDIGAINTVRHYLKDRGPFHLLHCHSTKAGMIGRLAVLSGSPGCLYTPHGMFAMDPNRSALSKRLASALEVALSDFGDRVIAVSAAEFAHAVEIGIPASKLKIIPNGVTLASSSPASDRAQIRAEWGLHDSEVCIGFVGRLVPVKSPETMLKGFACLRDSVRERARLVMVGDGPLEPKLRRLTTNLGIAKSVTWLGARDARTLMHVFDTLVVTSDSEVTPLVVLEAMTRGLPIVATRVGAVADTVQPGVNGFIVPVRGVGEITDALTVLVQNPDLRTRMGEASRRIVQAFSIDRMVDQTVRLYEEVVARKTGTAAIPAETTNNLPNGLIVERPRDVRS